MKFLLFLVISFAYAQVDIVFDIDWTIVYHVDEKFANDPRTYFVDGKYYRLADGAEEIVSEIIKHPDMRVSFFSGGGIERNRKLLEQIIIPGTDKSFYDFAYKVLSKEELLNISNNPELPFSQRYKKDLSLINTNLENIVILDDLADFTPKSQSRNLLWMGETYNFYHSWDNVGFSKFSPPSELAWLHERQKLFWSYDLIMEAYEKSTKEGSSFIKKLNELVVKRRPYQPSLKSIQKVEILKGKLQNKYFSSTAQSYKSCSSLFLPRR